MLKFGASVPTSSMVVGYPQREWSWMSAILKDPETNKFNIFDTDVWTHMCIAYDKETEFLRMFKVVGILQCTVETAAAIAATTTATAVAAAIAAGTTTAAAVGVAGSTTGQKGQTIICSNSTIKNIFLQALIFAKL